MTMRREDWESFPCEEHGELRCPICGLDLFKDYSKFVYITKDWSATFHRANDCWGLTGGQKKVERRGGEPAPIDHVAYITAIKTHFPCQICFPPKTQ